MNNLLLHMIIRYILISLSQYHNPLLLLLMLVLIQLLAILIISLYTDLSLVYDMAWLGMTGGIHNNNIKTSISIHLLLILSRMDQDILQIMMSLAAFGSVFHLTYLNSLIFHPLSQLYFIKLYIP